jgi:stringent starvation protein A
MGVVAKRSTMTFFSDAKDHYSHRLRIVLAEKGITVDIVDIDPDDIPQELTELNPYNSLPTLVDRDLTIYESRTMMEYLDERFPHPPLLPVYPVARAEIRQFIYRVENDWCPKVETILRSRNKEAVAAAQKDLRESLKSVAPIFADKPFFMSDEFSLVDCCLAPILWRLSVLGVSVPHTRQTQPLFTYMQRVFTRPSFLASLTEREREIKPALPA